MSRYWTASASLSTSSGAGCAIPWRGWPRPACRSGESGYTLCSRSTSRSRSLRRPRTASQKEFVMAQETKVKATFPSLEWLQALRDIINADEVYKRIGTCDAVVGVKVPDLQKYYRITFEAFEVLDVKEVSETDAEDADFWLEMPYARWQELIQNIKENGKADLHHTLNTIDLEDPEGFARSRDGYRRDAFYRFNQSFQHFFDSSAKIDTQFA